MSISIKKFGNKYKNLSAPVKASLWFTICSILQKGIAFITTPIFTRLMTPDQFGVYSVYMSWYSIVTIFATLNLYAGVFNKGLIKYKADENKFTSALLGLSTFVTIGLFVIYIVAFPFWNKLIGLDTIYVILMFIEILFLPAYNLWAAAQRFRFKYKMLILVTMIIAVGNPVLGVLGVVISTDKALARVITTVLVQVAVGLILYILAMRKSKKLVNKQYWKYALAFNLPLIPHYLSLTILNQADRIMISHFIGDGEAAIYSVAYSISNLMLIVINAINNTYVPYTYQKLHENDLKSVGKSTNFLLLFVAAICIIVISVGPEAIMLVATPEYYDARWAIPPLVAGIYYTFLYPLFGNIEFYFEKTKYVMIASCTGAAANILLNWIFIPIFGYYAAGYTTLFCYLLFVAGHYFFYRIVLKKCSEIKSIYNMKFIVVCSASVFAVMILMTCVYDFPIVRYSVVAAVLIVMFLKRKLIISKLRDIKRKKSDKHS